MTDVFPSAAGGQGAWGRILASQVSDVLHVQPTSQKGVNDRDTEGSPCHSHCSIPGEKPERGMEVAQQRAWLMLKSPWEVLAINWGLWVILTVQYWLEVHSEQRSVLGTPHAIEVLG